MNWTLSEFIYELTQDKSRRVLFVEGPRDLAFWRVIVPTLERSNTVIYPISAISLANVTGGERGRLLELAARILDGQIADRICFFADADYDRVLALPIPSNVTLTDGRDLESYALREGCLVRICLAGIGVDEERAYRILPLVITLTRPIGLMRILSLREKWDLPFQRTLGNRGLRGLILGDQTNAALDVTKLITVLLQNASISLAEIAAISTKFEDEIRRQREVSDGEIIHGKDFVLALSWLTDVGLQEAAHLLFLSLCADLAYLRSCPNLSQMESWIRRP